MDTTPTNTPLNDAAELKTLRRARIVSGVLSPLLMPTYCIIAAMWLTSLSLLPEGVRLGATAMVALLTAVVPLVYIIAMHRLGHYTLPVTGPAPRNTAANLVAIACLLLASYYLYRAAAEVWLVMIPVAFALTTLILTIVEVHYRLSAHAMSIGTLIGILCYLSVKGIASVDLTLVVMAAVLLSGIVGTARVILRRNTLPQLGWAWVIGMAVAYGAMHIRLFERFVSAAS